MSLNSKPLWTDGMFILPQHMQQQNRYLETLVERRSSALDGNGWGLRALSLDRERLRLGQVAVTACEAIMPDGSVLSIPADIEPPPLRDLPADTRGRLVKLALPARRGDALEAADAEPGRSLRYRPADLEVRDSTSPARELAMLRVAVPRVFLLLDGEDESDLVTLPLARVEQVDASGGVQLAPTFVPPCLRCNAHGRLAEVMREVEGLLRGLGTTLAGRVDPSRLVGEMAGILDYLLLATINRWEPLFASYGATGGVHPQALHTAMLQLAGELATFGGKSRRPPSFPPYRHDDIEASIEPVLAAIRAGLLVVIDERVVSLPLQARDYGIWIAPIAERALLRGARFVLAARSDAPPETMRTGFPMQVKLGPIDVIRDLVNLQIPGIPLEPLNVAPRELPYYGGYTYFELDQSHELWSRMANSSAFALHVGSEFGGLALELWAIRAARA